MPTIYQYLGIVIKFYSDEHEPIHVHAIYKEAEVVVSLFTKNDAIYLVRYKEVKGKFSPSKMRDLKVFISINKNVILFAWKQFFDYKVPIKPIIISKRIK